MTNSNPGRIAGHLLVEALIEQGVETVFGVPGESYLAVLDGFHEHPEKIRFIACRQEGGAAFMAEAQGKLSGRPGICFVTRGPGATNASIGLHTAFQDSTPLILFVGQVASDQRDREAFQELDYRQMFGPGTLGLAKWVGEVHDADRLPEYVARAFHTAMQGRPGPVVIVLPEDMLRQVTTAAVLPRAEAAQAWPAPAALASLHQRLAAAKQPLLIAGGGGWTADSCSALQSFAEAWQLPVACAFRFQDLFDNRHPLYAGDVGIGISAALAKRVQEADLIIALGPRLGEMTTGGYQLLQAPRPAQQLIHLHAGAEELGRVYAADLMINASMSCAAQALATLEAPVSVPWQQWTLDANADYQANRVAQPVSPLDMAEVIQCLNRLMPEDTIFTNGAGNFSGWLQRFHQYPGLHQQGRTQLAPTSGAMGYGDLGRQPCRRRRFPDDRPGVGHGNRLWRQTADQHRRRQRHLRHDPDAPRARISRPGFGQRSVQPRFRHAGSVLWLGGAAHRAHRRVRTCFARSAAGRQTDAAPFAPVGRCLDQPQHARRDPCRCRKTPGSIIHANDRV